MDFISLFEMSDKTYDKLKYFVQIILPAIATFIGIVGLSLKWTNFEPILTIFAAVIALLGTALGISNHNYKAHE